MFYARVFSVFFHGDYFFFSFSFLIDRLKRNFCLGVFHDFFPSPSFTKFPAAIWLHKVLFMCRRFHFFSSCFRIYISLLLIWIFVDGCLKHLFTFCVVHCQGKVQIMSHNNFFVIWVTLYFMSNFRIFISFHWLKQWGQHLSNVLWRLQYKISSWFNYAITVIPFITFYQNTTR